MDNQEEGFNSGDTPKTLDDLHMWVFTDLGFCGCGDPEGSLDFLRDSLNDINKESDERWNAMKARFPEGPMSWTYLYMLDDKGLTEHGSNIRGCWLTDKGKAILELLNKYSSAQISENDENIPDVLDASVII